MDTLRDFHGASPWIVFAQYYHLIVKSTINSSKNEGSVMVRYVETIGGCMIQPATLLKAVFSIPFLKSQHAVAENVSKGYTCLR